MKNPFSVLMFSLIALCSCAFILLIFVVVKTGGNFNIKQIFSREGQTHTASVQPEDAIPIPERFRQLDSSEAAGHDTTVSASGEPVAEVVEPVRTSNQRYFSTFQCNQMINGSDLKLLLADNHLFCKKSPWSQEWANPAGKGIRKKAEGLTFTDSTVIDSFTNLVWQRYASPKSYSYNKTAPYVAHLNSISWQGSSSWRMPKIEELMATFMPQKNSVGLHLPTGWNCRTKDVWSCNSATDSLNTRWIWVARTALGRCNVGHPDTPRPLLLVHEM